MSEVPTADVQAQRFRVPPAAVALVAPEAGMERVARAGRVRGPLLVALSCALLSAGAGVLRVDAKDATLRSMEKAGELQSSSDRQVEDNTRSAERIYLVKRVAGALVEPPLQLGLLCVAIFGLSWFLRGRCQEEDREQRVEEGHKSPSCSSCVAIQVGIISPGACAGCPATKSAGRIDKPRARREEELIASSSSSS